MIEVPFVTLPELVVKFRERRNGGRGCPAHPVSVEEIVTTLVADLTRAQGALGERDTARTKFDELSFTRRTAL